MDGLTWLTDQLTDSLLDCCFNTYKWLDILVFLDKDEEPYAHLTALSLFWFLWDVKELTLLFVNSRRRRPRWRGTTFHGLGG